MREFFRGWRRKFGLMTLLMACVLTAGWVRSSTFIEGVSIPLGMNQSASLVSYHSSLVWLTQHGNGFVLFPQFVSRRFLDIDDLMLENPFFEWRWQWCGFRYGVSVEGTKQVGKQMIQTTPGTVAVIPYWSIVLPLTLLSAFLLLTTPRNSAPKKITSPIPVEGA